MNFWTMYTAVAVLLLIGAGRIAWIAIGTTGRHGDLDFSDRPNFTEGRADQLDRLMSQYTLPLPILEDLLLTDLFLARIRAIAGPVTP